MTNCFMMVYIHTNYNKHKNNERNKTTNITNMVQLTFLLENKLNYALTDFTHTKKKGETS